MTTSKSNLPVSNRLKNFRVEPRALVELLRTGASFKIAEGIPRTAKCIGADYDVQYHMFNLIIQDDSFDEAPESQMLPYGLIAVEDLRHGKD